MLCVIKIRQVREWKELIHEYVSLFELIRVMKC